MVGVELLVVAWALFCLEGAHKTVAEETDLERGVLLGYIDAVYWAVLLES